MPAYTEELASNPLAIDTFVRANHVTFTVSFAARFASKGWAENKHQNTANKYFLHHRLSPLNIEFVAIKGDIHQECSLSFILPA